MISLQPQYGQWPRKGSQVSAETYQGGGAHFKALNEAVLMALSKILEKFFFPFRVYQPPWPYAFYPFPSVQVCSSEPGTPKTGFEIRPLLGINQQTLLPEIEFFHILLRFF